MPQKIEGSQTDFSFGEVDPDLKRADGHPARKGGLRQMSNARIHNSGTIQNRSGRSALFVAGVARVEKFTILPGQDFELLFGAGVLAINNAAGAQVFNTTLQGSGAALPWTALNTNLVVYAVFGLSIYLTFPGMKPQVITFDGTATWAIADYTELLLGGAQKRTPFYRISPRGIGIQPSARIGNITLSSSTALFTPAWVGTRIRWIGRQILITGFVNSGIVNAQVQEPLPGLQIITFTVNPATIYSVGDEVIGSVTGSKGIIVAVSPGPVTIAVQLISTNISSSSTSGSFFRGYQQDIFAFAGTDTIIGPSGGLVPSSVAAIQDPTALIDIWDQEVMNPLQGYPAGCFTDQFRVGFTNFPAVPGGIAWSAINSPNDLYVGSNPQDAMFEIAPAKTRVLYVIPGPEGSEFVFCDRGVFYIPISETNPLKPGSVAFKRLSGDGAARVQPRLAQEAIIYINAGGNSPMAIIATGAYLRPFNTKSLSDYHNHLFNNVQCIACPDADTTFNERYAYILNGDGSIAVGKYKAESLAGNEPVIGWGPWSGAGTVKWIHAWGQDALFTTAYFGITICEKLDDTVYMDASLFVNALPAAFTPPGGKGPLWWIPNSSVFLMDQGTRPMGVYQINADGFIVPQNNGGENLAAASLVAGQIWTGAAEPFAPLAQPGADQGQRIKPRSFAYFCAYVLHSTGFKFQALFSGKQTRATATAGITLGTPMNERRVPAYNTDDDTTLPPVQRETAEEYPPQGTTFDPRARIVWDTPGPFQLLEIAMEITP